MYPANFDYFRAGSVGEAVALMQSHPGAKLLAGGHSLLPAMKLRVANPDAVIDIGRVDELKGISVANGFLTIGALTTHAEVAASAVVKANCPVLAQAASGIGDQMVRNRGTIGGSVAHADPQADYPTILRALRAVFSVFGSKGMRTVSAEDMFTGLFTTALGDGDIITSVTIPTHESGTGGYYYKIPHPASGYAVVGACAVVSMSDGKCTSASVVVGGATPNPVRCTGVEANLVNNGNVGTADIDASMGDNYASAEYRKHLANVAVSRAVEQAMKHASA
jgi:carbon-monoxide dehydrogenase medium subunit